MYAFRKPFSAGTYEGETALGGALELKTAFVVSQIIGYTISKYVGIKFCSELPRSRRLQALIGAIVLAEITLLFFGALPGPLKIVAIFANGLPLGMVWGFVVSYLEGRRTSEVQLAGLACSFIVASGVVKDIGRWLMTLDVAEYWMPFVTGLLFLPPFLLAAWLLDMMPEPNEGDVEERVERRPMTAAERWAYVRHFAVGLAFLIIVYLGLTAFRDFRDNYGVEIFAELGYGDSPAIFTRSELWVAFGVLIMIAPMSMIRNNRLALYAVFGLLALGCAMIGVSTWLLQREAISGLTWMVLVGLGAYTAYVPYNTILFDRIVAATRTIGTAVFGIYLADAVGYTGSTALQLYKDLAQREATRLEFFMSYCYVLSVAGVVLLAVACWDFARAARLAEERHAAEIDP